MNTRSTGSARTEGSWIGGPLRVRFPLPLLGLASLACGGLFVSASDRARLVEILHQVDPDEAVDLFVVAGVEVGLVNLRCGQCAESFARASADMRQHFGATALLDASRGCLCPSTCATAALPEAVSAEADIRMSLVGRACDEQGPDPLFEGELAGLRPSVDAIDYAMVRMMVEALEGTDELPPLRRPLAVGLAVRGGERPDAPDELVVTGHGREPFQAAATTFDACKEGLSHRLVVDPDGAVAAVHGAGCEAELRALILPGEGWRVVDVGWSAAGIAAHDAAPDRDEEGAENPADGALPAGEPTVKGALDPALIQKVVRRHLNQVRYCYERALAKTPDLSGKIVVSFVIGRDGGVASATATEGMDPEVDACVVGRFRRMQFPEPSGGGIVSVSYPFVFAPG